ncbi:MAG: threonylcarbamoyl-AMP synthase [Ignavibacteriae bacterium]|nr:threonylcarbamoyl-AMP synthase [Ignavibacteriota bacterium]
MLVGFAVSSWWKELKSVIWRNLLSGQLRLTKCLLFKFIQQRITTNGTLNTRFIKISSATPEPIFIDDAAEVLLRGGLVAFPTETVYGLGADALNPEAVRKVFAAKGRPADNPLIVHIASIEQLFELGKDISPIAQTLAETFMPGPLTLVVKHSSIVPEIVTAGLDTIALRMPNHAVPLALIRALKRGIVGPSANLSGKPSPTTAQHVFDDLNGKIEMILDAGPTEIGVESTVLDTTTNPPTILRPGGISRERIEQAIGTVQTSKEIELLKRSPGTRHRHYAPKAKVVLIEHRNVAQLKHALHQFKHEGKKTSALVYSSELLELSNGSTFHKLPETIEGFSQQLFDKLRALDQLGSEIILIETVTETGLGVAVMDRLRRASEKM